MPASVIGLNPYYTGIHLHSSEWKGTWQEINVLILIILEYIYILDFSQSGTPQWGLNPYYTGIHLHRNELLRRRCLRHVLILIILEYIYIN